MDTPLLIIIGIIVVIVLYVVITYNRFITFKTKGDEGWADIDTQLKRRYDLIPNMVETVKGYATHEKGTLEAVIKARNMAIQATTPDQKAQAENMLTGTLKTLFAVAENYPALQANQNFMDLQSTLREIEDHIQLSRRYYNATVRDFNVLVDMFPSNIIAGIFNFKKRTFFEIERAEERENVKVSFEEKK